MLGRIAALSLPCLFGLHYYLKCYPINFTNPQLGALLSFVNQHKPQYSIVIFKALLNLQILSHDPLLSNYVLRSGFDVDGKYIQQVKKIGFKGIEVGPISLNPSIEEQSHQHIGIMSALARINSHRQNNPCQSFEIHLHIVPNLQVLKFTPYLLKENIIETIKAYADVQQVTKQKILDCVRVEFDREDAVLEGKESQEVKKMMLGTIREGQQLVKQFEEKFGSQVQFEFGRGREKYLSWKDLLAYITGEKTI